METEQNQSQDTHLDFIETLDLEKLKYEISSELGEMSEEEALLFDSAERRREVIPPKIKVRVPQDKLKAYLTVARAGTPIPMTEKDIRNSLKENGIVKGVLEKKIEEILVEKLIGQEVLIARGVSPEESKDGYIKLLLDAKAKAPEECVDARGRVDFKQIGQNNMLEAGDIIAEIVPPVQGKEGWNVLGEILLPKPGAEVEFTLTPDVGLSPENEMQLVALKSGILKKNFTIDEINVIQGDVDFSTGNIEYEKSLVIKGDVKSGFSVHCGEDIEVRGCVEDAEVVADGDVVVKQGFLGNHKGFIKGKNVTIGHMKQQRVEASGDIVVGGEVIHSELFAGGFIQVLGVRGVAIGGKLTALKGIELMKAGNIRNVKTSLCVGYSREIMEMEAQEEQLKGNLEKAENALKLLKVASTIKNLPPGMVEKYGQIQDTQEYLVREVEKLRTKTLERIEDLLRTEQPYVKVAQNIFPNTTIQIGHLKNPISSEMRNKRFCYLKNKIYTGV